MRLTRLVILCMVLTAATMLAQEQFPARIDLIGAEIFGVDRSHSHLGFTIGFLGMTKVRGTFNDFTATILYDDVRPERSSVTFVIDPASIDTHNEFRDKDLQSDKFFDVARYPEIVFQSSRIEKKGKESFLVHGDLTIKGVTRQVSIPMTRTVPRGADAAWGNIRIGGSGAVTVRRKDFNILGNEFWGDKTLSNEVDVEIDLLGNRPNYDRWSFQSKEKPSIGEVLAKTIEVSGAKAAAAQFRELKQEKPDDYNFGPGQVNIAINRLMQRRKLQEALELLKIGTEFYPEESGFWARSGEAWAALGNRDQAIRAYEKAQSINPGGTESREMLRRLKTPGPTARLR